MAWKKATFVSLWLAALSLAICSTFIFIACGLKFSIFHSGLTVSQSDFVDNTPFSIYLWQMLPETARWSDYAFSGPGLIGLTAFVASIGLGSYAAIKLEEINHATLAAKTTEMHRWDSMLVGSSLEDTLQNFPHSNAQDMPPYAVKSA
ncbi:hypothetical protein CSR02_03080 [Acetobacter pomorum]|uniref:Uncharacterized protein n=1 Tax=Acetobacter pomorum TaxID=65959 RepID=A0A2G4REN1_9PROT|nr:hypothetical protein [Acetobacter pomorum]KDE21498.1 hypothetical protein AZ09_01515 [Acetobacter aceti 1023]PHY95026.1 hypothetical protein CSR02_03080 [Acetobacter pomorum]GBR51236.1 hypothetical protein AA11825_1918 [Acetobacter pomorum DSM 11825]